MNYSTSKRLQVAPTIKTKMDDKRFLANVWTGGFFLLMLILTLTSGCQNIRKDVYKAAREGDLPRVKTLLTSEPDLEKRDGHAFGALFHASRTGQIEVVKFCLESGVSANGYGAWNPLHTAAGHGHLEVVKLLLANGADIDRCSRGKDSGTPLYFAIAKGQKDTTRILLENGADANEKCGNVESPLLRALKNEQIEIADMLLSYGTNINDKTNGVGTALHVAIALDNLHMAKYLLSKGADVNAEVGSGCTPLHMAAYCNKVEIASILLRHGANPALRCDGRTTLEIAYSDEFHDLLQQHR